MTVAFVFKKIAEKEGWYLRRRNGKGVKGRLKTYEVFVEDRRIGTVEQYEASSHRMAGRLIAATSHPIEWVYCTPCGTTSYSLSRKTRQHATEDLWEAFQKEEQTRP